MCCEAGAAAYPHPCPWHGLMSDAAMLIGVANTHGVATLSADEDNPPELLEVTALWYSTAVMAWREVE